MHILLIFTDLGSSFGAMGCPKNRVFDIKSGYNFLAKETLSRLLFFSSTGKAGVAS